MNKELLENRNVLAWLLLVSAVAIHVLDEALTGFLPYWNQLVTNRKGTFQVVPLPTFAFGVWLGGLILAVLVGYALILVVKQGGKFIRWFTTALGILMLLNASGHLLGSLIIGRILPGMWSSPFLFLASIYVIFRGLRGEWVTNQPNIYRSD